MHWIEYLHIYAVHLFAHCISICIAGAHCIYTVELPGGCSLPRLSTDWSDYLYNIYVIHLFAYCISICIAVELPGGCSLPRLFTYCILYFFMFTYCISLCIAGPQQIRWWMQPATPLHRRAAVTRPSHGRWGGRRHGLLFTIHTICHP